MSNILKLIIAADFHIGKLNPIDQYENIYNDFIVYCQKSKPDIVVIDGDITDEKVALNSITASMYNKFIDELIKLNTVVIIVEGTKSHDDNQISAHLHKVNDTFRVYKTVTSDYVKGLKILLIPEEYMHDPDEYYKNYLCGTYDFIFGHGLFNHVGYFGSKKHTFKRLTSPTWDYEKHFKRIVSGRVMFGHVHIHSKKDKYYSVGSFGRYNFGEEDNKGFIEIEYDVSKHKVVKEKHIVNKNALIFKTIDESTLSDNRDDFMLQLKELSNKSYKLRILISREISNIRKSDIVSFSKENLNTCIENKYEKKKMASKSQEESNYIKIENKYENMDIVDATVEFIKEKHNFNIDRNHVIKILNDDEKL